MSLNLLQNKYKPTNINEILGNYDTIKYIKKWLDEYDIVKDFLKKNGLLKKSSKGRKKKLINLTEDEIEYSKRFGNLLITGSHGSGKSTIVNFTLKSKIYKLK
jgi:polynucleotide 5'-kinase involved in rRNA processing